MHKLRVLRGPFLTPFRVSALLVIAALLVVRFPEPVPPLPQTAVQRLDVARWQEVYVGDRETAQQQEVQNRHASVAMPKTTQRLADEKALRNFIGETDALPLIWILSVATEGREFLNVEFVDDPPNVFATVFDESRQKFVLRASRRFIRSAPTRAVPTQEMQVGRLVFVHEVLFAGRMADPMTFHAYRECAYANVPTKKCLDVLVRPHYESLKGLWMYVKEKTPASASYFPSYLAGFARSGVLTEMDEDEKVALSRYLWEGQLRNMFWMPLYEDLKGI